MRDRDLLPGDQIKHPRWPGVTHSDTGTHRAEVYALLIVYQLLRTAIADAAFAAGIDPDRGSFTVALNTARDQLIQASKIITGTVIDLIGTIGRQILDQLMPDRRIRVSPRIVKRAISKYQARGPNINRTSYKATISINILAPPNP